jgi:Cu(I)/Ag(I) efflux system membrane protein CusA/SilA
VQNALPPGVRIVPVYDRSTLIRGAVGTLAETLVEELVVVSLIIMLFLGHVRTALVPVLVLPIAVLAAFIPMAAQGITVNIMSLAGIAVAVGAMVDSAIGLGRGLTL